MADHPRAVREDFVFSHGHGMHDIDPQEETMSFAAFAVMIQKWKLRHGKLKLDEYMLADRKHQTADKNGPYFIPASFSRAGRRAEHLVKSYAFVADFDRGDVDGDRIAATLEGLNYVAWTTYSHSDAKAKWRVVVPYDRPVGAEHHEAIFAHFQRLFEGAIDEASRRPAQLYYLPGCPRDAVELHECTANTEDVHFDTGSEKARAPVPAVAVAPVAGQIGDAAKLADMESALECVLIPKEDGSGRYKLWLSIGMALHHETSGSEAGLRMWRDWHRAQGYDRNLDECGEKWPSFHKRRYGSARLTGATLFDLARKHGWRQPRVGDDDVLEDLPIEFSEDHLASEFAQVHGDSLRYVHAWGKWYHWNGSRWQEEKTLYALDLVRTLCREKAVEARARNDLTASKRDRIALTLSQAHTVMAVLGLARADRRIATRTDQWDNDRYLLNTPDGTVDLRTGQLRFADPEDFITKVTRVAPSGRCPVWDSFLKRVMGENTELILFLQRLMGYALTGDVSEHALTFCYGTGGNGKSTFLNTMAALMGDYAIVAPAETFIEGRSDRHPTELAMLRGARLVVAQEVEEGRRWAEARVKSLTGGEPVTARFMRQDFFTFEPHFKLVVGGNHKPGLRSIDEAIRRRMHLVPWLVTIPAEERDTKLMEKLEAEWPGIFAWAIEGCLAWQRHGLSAPREIASATDSYLADEDQVAQWLGECCEVKGSLREPRSFVYASYKRWCEESGERAVLNARRFYDRLEGAGFVLSEVAGVRYVNGLKTKFDTASHLRPLPPTIVKSQ